MSRHLDPAVGSSWYSVYQNVVSIEQTGDTRGHRHRGQPRLAVQPRDGRLGRRHRVGRHARRDGRRLRQLDGRRELHRARSASAEWKAGERITLERYDDYWDPELIGRKVGRGRVPLHERPQRARERAGSRARSTAAGWSRSTRSPQLRDSDPGDMLFGLNTAVSSLIVSQPRRAARRPRTCARRCSWRSTARASSTAASKGYGEVTNALTTESVWVGASDAAVTAAFDGLEEYPYDVDGGEAARRGRRRRPARRSCSRRRRSAATSPSSRRRRPRRPSRSA